MGGNGNEMRNEDEMRNENNGSSSVMSIMHTAKTKKHSNQKRAAHTQRNIVNAVDTQDASLVPALARVHGSSAPDHAHTPRST